ncbi:MAG: hypothetical protein SGPRY_009232 [Prymnesium sp.]
MPQVRETINIGLRRIHMLNSRRERMKAGAIKRVSKAMTRISFGSNEKEKQATGFCGRVTTSPTAERPPSSNRSVTKVRP